MQPPLSVVPLLMTSWPSAGYNFILSKQAWQCFRSSGRTLPHLPHHSVWPPPPKKNTIATTKNKGRLQPLTHSAEKVTPCNLPPLQDLYSSRNLGWAGRTVADLTTLETNSLRNQNLKRKVSSWLQLATSARPRTRTYMNSYAQASLSIYCINEKSTHLT